MISIDGSQGEGGGQVLRSSLALSLVTARPFRIQNIRAHRRRPGLMRQHLTAVNAAAKVGQAKVTGATLHSQELTFVPGQVRPGEFHFAVGTAGSATLVLQTVLPALLRATGASALRLEGGTHNPWAPPFDFLAQSFLPIVSRMGPAIQADLVRPGFYPAGGGELHVNIEPARALGPIELLERGPVLRTRATAKVARLPQTIAERELQRIASRLNLSPDDLVAENVTDSRGPGNVVTIQVQCQHVTEVFTGFGQRGVPAEAVADQAIEPAQRYLSAGVPIGEHLADQLLIPFALTGGGAFRTVALSHHARTNIQVIKHFLDIDFDIDSSSPPGCVVRVHV